MAANNRTVLAFATANAESGEFAGENFSNNLFTDLAPLLTLFGEQVTKQFMSQAMGWADNVLLGMAPIGILTSVVSAIRVGGRRWLKALIGRARESRPAAESELLSSTSDSVCELWSGNEIVRDRGNPETIEIIYKKWDKDNPNENVEDMVYDLKMAHRKGVYRAKGLEDSAEDHRRVTELTRQAPNLTLNVPKALSSQSEVKAFACVGIIIQLLILVTSALTTYHWKLQSGGSAIATYGYPCFVLGSISLSLGTILCSHIIEGSTDELDFMPTDSSEDFRVVRIQRTCTVSEQLFPSFAIFNAATDRVIRTSRLNVKTDYSFQAAVATCTSLIGYIVQFIGLRAMHWTSAISTLIGTLLMTAIRSFVRRGLAKDPDNVLLHEGLELSWLAYEVMGLDRWELLCGSYIKLHNLQSHEEEPRQPGDGASHIEKHEPRLDMQIFRTVEVRAYIQNLVMWHDNINIVSSQLVIAISQVMRIISSDDGVFLDDEPSLPEQRLESRAYSRYTPKKKGAWFGGREDHHIDNSRQSVSARNSFRAEDPSEQWSGPATAKPWLLRQPSFRSIDDSEVSVQLVEGVSQRGRYRVKKDDQGIAMFEPVNDEPLKSRFRFQQNKASFEWETDVIYRSTGDRADKREAYKFTIDSGPLDNVSGDEVQWNADIGTFVAVISLWLATVHKNERDSATAGYYRLLGDAKDIWVTTSAHRHRDEEEVIEERNHMVDGWAGEVENEGIDPNIDIQSPNQAPSDTESHHSENHIQGEQGLREDAGTHQKLTKESVAVNEAQGNPNTRISIRNGAKFEEKRTNNYALWIDRGVNSHQVEFPNSQKRPNAAGLDGGPHEYPVFGFTASAFMREERERSGITPEAGNEPTQARRPSRIRGPWKGHPKTERAVISHAPLERLLAQEIFANFLFALTAYFKELKFASKARLDFEGPSSDELRWSNPMITKLAQAVESSGLATYEEAYMLVVPPFYARGLLPTSYSKKRRNSGISSDYSGYYTDYSASSESRTRHTRRSREDPNVGSERVIVEERRTREERSRDDDIVEVIEERRPRRSRRVTVEERRRR